MTKKIRIISFLIFSFLFTNSFLVYANSIKRLINFCQCPEVENNILDLANSNLSSLKGIQNYPGIESVKHLILRDNKLTSLDALQSLEDQIEILDIASNQITDLTGLEKFPNLTYLYIEGNKINRDQIAELYSKSPNKRLQIFYSKDEKKKKSKKNKRNLCPICRSILGNDENAISETKCHHYFHTECLDRWKAVRKNCPMCRADIE